MKFDKTYYISLFFIIFLPILACAQKDNTLTFFEKSDSIHKTRLVVSSAFSATTYSAFSYGLYNVWYKQYDQEKFHFFDDIGEWRHVDKLGHMYTAYVQGVLCYEGAKWTGLSENESIVTGVLLGSLFQSTIEVMDGFSSKWGFSLADMGMNLAGSGVFASQQLFWGEQRINLKVSNFPKSYSEMPLYSVDGLSISSLQKRADNLYGSSYAERFLKDYNSQVNWASINIHSFFPDSSFPEWLNIAVGYGAGNLYGGYENKWSENNSVFVLSESEFPRYSSIYISPDINFSKINTKSYFANTLLDILNIFKAPLPAIEINTKGEFLFHWFI